MSWMKTDQNGLPIGITGLPVPKPVNRLVAYDLKKHPKLIFFSIFREVVAFTC
jgi:hypothetical protein